ncbi:MAG TPA: hypothetical protein VGH54_10365 [Mycobacterium sp.]|jgi:hypothetical protein|uniref:hypothetical protein n=1 Tax=Mycobacterium sp. TaxID=1785 RepID=UPI002F3E6901
MTLPTEPLCEYSVHWWDVDIDETCRRPLGHHGHHTDGLWYFDDNGLRVPHGAEDDS